VEIVERFPHVVREIEHCWIPMPDGCRLGARIWLPSTATASPVPAILEYIPYGKRDGTRERDEPMHRYFAGHGYAAVRVDLRGSGDSDGRLGDEYLEQEQDDAVHVIRWIASQPWCSGAVGMMGKSWGGMAALQVAARRPPELGCIITVCASDDRYADDAHYMGGCLLNENLLWGSVLFTLAAEPPDPELVGPSWRRTWLERIENLPLYPAIWMRHPVRDDYWKHGSVSVDYSRIRCPVYAVGGWADGYTNAVPRLLAELTTPRKGLVGPWAHLYPHDAVPEPSIGFLQEACHWWDRWLCGADNGIMEEPMYRVWMQESIRPQARYLERPGRWVAESDWPSARIVMRRMRLAPGRLVADGSRHSANANPGAASIREERTQSLSIRSPQTVGTTSGSWCSFGVSDQPGDQQPDDARSLCFDSDPLDEPFEMLGQAHVVLALAADRPLGFVAVRLNEVAPSGESLRVTYALRNLTLADGGTPARRLEPGRPLSVRIPLKHAAHAFAAGNRVRLALSTTYWPMVWPSPEPVTLQVFPAESWIELPVRPHDGADARLPEFAPPASARPPAVARLHRVPPRRSVHTDPETGEIVRFTAIDLLEDGSPAISRLGDIDLDIGHGFSIEQRIHDDDPLSARVEVVHRTLARRGGWSVRVDTRMQLTCTRDRLRLQADLDAFDGDRRVAQRGWDETVPRDLL
jgi:putative CocE/NonD family hydrolase